MISRCLTPSGRQHPHLHPLHLAAHLLAASLELDNRTRGSRRHRSNRRRRVAHFSNREAGQGKAGGTIKLVFPSGDSYVFDAVEARAIHELNQGVVSRWRVDDELRFLCLPSARGAEQTLGTFSQLTDPVLTAVVSGIKGQLPAYGPRQGHRPVRQRPVVAQGPPLRRRQHREALLPGRRPHPDGRRHRLARRGDAGDAHRGLAGDAVHPDRRRRRHDLRRHLRAARRDRDADHEHRRRSAGVRVGAGRLPQAHDQPADRLRHEPRPRGPARARLARPGRSDGRRCPDRDADVDGRQQLRRPARVGGAAAEQTTRGRSHERSSATTRRKASRACAPRFRCDRGPSAASWGCGSSASRPPGRRGTRRPRAPGGG